MYARTMKRVSKSPEIKKRVYFSTDVLRVYIFPIIKIHYVGILT